MDVDGVRRVDVENLAVCAVVGEELFVDAADVLGVGEIPRLLAGAVDDRGVRRTDTGRASSSEPLVRCSRGHRVTKFVIAMFGRIRGP